MAEQDLLKLDPIEMPQDLKDMQSYAAVFIQSGMFKDTRTISQGIVRIMAGREIGISPFASMRGINMIDGHPEIAANLMAALIKQKGKYDFRTRNWTAKGCTIDWFEKANSKREKIGETSFVEEDARTAGLLGKNNWRNYPKDMYFARALSSGAKKFVGDTFNGVSVFVESELDDVAITPAIEPMKLRVAKAEAEAEQFLGKIAQLPEAVETSVEEEVKEDIDYVTESLGMIEKLGLNSAERMRLIKDATGSVKVPNHKDQLAWKPIYEAIMAMANTSQPKLIGAEGDNDDDATN